MSRFINLTFSYEDEEKDMCVKVESIASYVVDPDDATKTKITFSNSQMNTENFIANLTVIELESLIAAATEATQEFVIINTGNPFDPPFTNTKISVENMDGFAFCAIDGLTEYNILFVRNSRVIFCTSESIATIKTKIYT